MLCGCCAEEGQDNDLHFSVMAEGAVAGDMGGMKVLAAPARSEAPSYASSPGGYASSPQGYAVNRVAQVQKIPDMTTRWAYINKQGKAIGLRLDMADGMVAQISQIKDGAIMDYNYSVQPEQHVREGDFIVSVNGASGDTKKMVQMFKKQDQLKLEVVRVEPFMINLTKPPISPGPTSPVSSAPASPKLTPSEARAKGRNVQFEEGSEVASSYGGMTPPKQKSRRQGALRGGTGLVLSHAPDSLSILVVEVGEGPIMDWNRMYPNLAVKKNDRLVSVNGITGTQMMKVLNKSERVEIAVLRPPHPPDTFQDH